MNKYGKSTVKKKTTSLMDNFVFYSREHSFGLIVVNIYLIK